MVARLGRAAGTAMAKNIGNKNASGAKDDDGSMGLRKGVGWAR